MVLKIVRFKKIYKFATDDFFIGVISSLLFIKNVFIKIKNSISPPKYTRHGKMSISKIFHLKKIYIFSADHFFLEVISFFY